MNNEKEYFDNHEQVSRLYFTSDQLAFFDENNAINHAQTLDDQTVISKTREEVEAELEQLTKDNWEDLDSWLDELDAE